MVYIIDTKYYLEKSYIIEADNLDEAREKAVEALTEEYKLDTLNGMIETKDMTLELGDTQELYIPYINELEIESEEDNN